MSIQVHISSLPLQEREQIGKDLTLKVKFNYISVYDFRNNIVYLPFSYGVQYWAEKDFQTNSSEFTGILREEQKKYRNTCIKQLNQNKSVILATHVGFGKSIIACNIASKIKLKTLVIVNRIGLIKQWEKTISSFFKEPKIQILNPKTNLDLNCDFFIINSINIPKISSLDFIGFVIVDELHLIVSETLFRNFFYVQPKYLLGLSATPYRSDELDSVIELFFGKNIVYKQLFRKHLVKIIKTTFKPKPEFVNGQLFWSGILLQQANNEERNKVILKIIVDELKENNNFLVLCKRVEQIKWFEENLNSLSISNECLYEDKQPESKQVCVVVGTIQKIGTGFDYPFLNRLIIAGDVEEYFIQYLGRVFRKPDIVPVIYDFKDDDKLLPNKNLNKHLNGRIKIYKKHGGIVEILK